MPTTKELMDAMLQELDDEQIADGLPPSSCLVTHDDGSVSTAFLRTVEKHKLQREGETLQETIKRCREAAFRYAQTGEA